jgi:molybdopterin-guanine dinucleotide biosynthesis protein A
LTLDRLLGAIIAGGLSRRFGSDKALALIDGRPMLDHVSDALQAMVAEVVVCGRAWREFRHLADRPEPGCGPLGGLAAALAHAREQGFDAVLSVPVDVLPLPPDLPSRLAGGGPRVLAGQHLIGLWPAALASGLDEHLAAGHRSIRSWIEASGAVRVAETGLDLVNANTPDGLPGNMSG